MHFQNTGVTLLSNRSLITKCCALITYRLAQKEKDSTEKFINKSLRKHFFANASYSYNKYYGQSKRYN